MTGKSDLIVPISVAVSVLVFLCLLVTVLASLLLGAYCSKRQDQPLLSLYNKIMEMKHMHIYIIYASAYKASQHHNFFFFVFRKSNYKTTTNPGFSISGMRDNPMYAKVNKICILKNVIVQILLCVDLSRQRLQWN